MPPWISTPIRVSRASVQPAMSSNLLPSREGMYTPWMPFSRPFLLWHWAQVSASSLGATMWVIGQVSSVLTKPYSPL